MEKTLYDLMDWAGIEELVYSESSSPHDMLGAHVTEAGLLVQALIPTAVEVSVKIASTGKKYPMELADEAGFFAALIPRKSVTPYTLIATYDNGVREEFYDPYSFAPQFTQEDLKKFGAGIHYSLYEKMGAHPMTIDGVKGVYFCLWAPCALRVSVVGDFNLWDGRRHQMRLLGEGDASVFELFIPGLAEGEIYKYEIKTKAGEPMLKSDPYGNYGELRPNNASVVWDIHKYQWKDQDWLEQRARAGALDRPCNIYEVHLGSWIRKDWAKDESGASVAGSEFYNYREIAVKLAEYVKGMGYTHVELMPVMEHPLDESWGYQVTGYYAPTRRYGTPDDFKYFMDYMHSQGIGVILDWVPAHFPRDAYGLATFDGTCVYEHMDPRQGSHPHWGTLIYNYGRPGVSNFLIANALFWADVYHADGIRMDAVASMLYLDYGKNEGEWVPNIYGGNENLEAVEFLKHLSTVFKGRKDGTVLIAEESTAWPKVTGEPEDGGLGFDFKWNMGWMNDFTNFMCCDPFFRKNNYGQLTFSLLYAYSENFVLVFSHDEVVHGKGSMIGKMPGATLEEKAQNLRAAYGFMMGHPGKKLLFMGQEYGQVTEWNEGASLRWELLEQPLHRQVQDYVKALNKLYLEQPALYQLDYEPEGFEWINCSYHEESMVMFVRSTRKRGETLLFVCNFDKVDHEKFRLGVPFPGKYKEILNSDAREFGGEGRVNGRVKTARQLEWDERDYSIEIHIPPMSVSIYTCTPETKTAGAQSKQAKPRKTASKKSGSGKGAGQPAVRKGADGANARITAEAERPAGRASRKTLSTAREETGKMATEKDGGKRLSTAEEETGKIATEKGGQKRLSTAKEETGKIATKKGGQKRLTTTREEPERIATEKDDQKRLTTAKEEPGKIATEKGDQKRLTTTREEPERIATEKGGQKRLTTAKEEPGKIATKKGDQKRLTTTREEPERIATEKDDQKRLSTAKEEPGKIATKKGDQKRLTTAKEEPEKIATEKDDQKKLTTAKEEPGKI